MAPFIMALLSSGLRLVANAALVKGKDFIKEKTGVDLDQAALSEADQLKLRQFQAEHEEELLRLQLEDNKLAFEETKAYLADVADARKNQAAILMSADAPWYAKAIQPALAAFVVSAAVVLFWLFFLWAGKSGAEGGLNPTQKDIVLYILGVLSAAVTQILGYYFGSSKGSAEKSKQIDVALAQKGGGDGK
ncbi:hypothetical protein [Roseateles violae]|uniref:Holin (3TMs family) n=1 Tax=Roseateles violae TaxID=3058042 RepID=A0ABT8DUK9_9BURK|nr:hypothetical protein [Pelomonas sp. PFR6]MDN3921995.1 hypothetical protein [Pelomonas sp. PFR6]